MKGRPRAAVAAAVLVAWALRSWRLAEANVWWDEALAVWAVRKGFAGVTLWTAGDVHGPVYFWLLWAWTSLVGEGEFVARLMSAGVGTAVVPAAYVLGRRLGGSAGGVGAAVAVATSRLLVWWSMELRMYMVAGLFVALAAYFALRWLAAPRGRWLVAYALAALAATHSVYLAGAGLAAINLGVLVCLVSRHRRDSPALRLTATWTATHVALALAHLPWLALALPRMSSWSSLREPASAAFVARLWATLLANGESVDVGAAGPWAAMFLAGTASALLVARRRLAGAQVLLWMAIVPPAVVWAATQPRSIFYSPSIEARYFVPFAPAVLALIGAAVGVAVAGSAPGAATRLAGRRVLTRLRRAAAVILVAAVMGPSWAALGRHYQGRAWSNRLPAMIQSVWTQAESSDALLLVSGNRYPVWLYEYDMPAPPGARLPGAPIEGSRLPGHPGAPAHRPRTIPFPDAGGGPLAGDGWHAELDRLMAAHDRVWLVEVEAHLQDPGGAVRSYVSERLPLVFSEGFGPDSVHLFAAGGRAPEVAQLAGAVAVEPGVWAERLPASAVAGDQVEVVLYSTLQAMTVSLEQAGSATILPVLIAAARATQIEEPAPAREGGQTPRRLRGALDITERVPAGRYQVVARGASQVYELGELTVRGSTGALVRSPLLAQVGEYELKEAGWRYVGGGWLAGLIGTNQHPLRALNRLGGSGGSVRSVIVDLVWQRAGEGLNGAGRGAQGPTVFVHLLGQVRSDGGTVWAGSDAPPSSGPWPVAPTLFDRHVLDLPHDAPPGDYQLEVGLYDPATGERHPVAGAGADSANQRVLIGPVTVGR